MTQPQILTKESSQEVFGGTQRPALVPEFKFLDEVPRGESETFLLYGPTGSGKSRLLGTCGDRALLIDNGKGIDTIRSPAFEKNLGIVRPIVVQLHEKLGKRGVYTEATLHDALCDTIDFALEKFPERFDYICIDDSTFMRHAAMHKALELNQETNKSKTKKDIVDEWDVIAPAVQDFGIEMSILDQFFASYTHICKMAKKHLVVCAHERQTFKKAERIGEQPELLKVVPSFTGVDKNPSAISIYFNNVWHTEVIGSGDNRIWRVTTKGHEKLAANTVQDGIFEVVETIPKNQMFMQECIRRIREAVPLKKLR